FSTNPNNGSDYRISNMTITAGRNLISLNDTVDGSGWRTHIVIENVNFSGASEASLRSYGGLIEEFYVRQRNHHAGQYFLKCENATIGGISGWFDKTAFENVTIGGCSENGIRIESGIGNAVLFKSVTINTSMKQGIYLDGGIVNYQFHNLAFEGNCRTGKRNETTGSITSGTTSLVVADAT